jgi:cysteine desulfurase/selenocysteine lyase
VSTNVEFPSVTYPLLRMAEMDKDVNVKLVEADELIVPLNSILDEIDEDTQAIFITHVENLSGQVHDIERITWYAHEKGALVIVDGIQAAGRLPLSVRKLGVDVYIIGSYKYLCAPFGVVIAYISKELYERAMPVFVGWRTSEASGTLTQKITYPSTARKFEYSTSAYGVKLGLAESIKYLLNVGIHNIHSHDLKLVAMLKEEFDEGAPLNVITPTDHGSIFTFRPLNMESGDVAARLRGTFRPVELSVRQGLIRLSPHLYNTEEDIQEVVESLKQVL